MRLIVLSLLVFALAACSSGGAKMPPDNSMPVGHQGGSAKVGNPYKIGGTWYTPKHEPYYEEVGIASWYGKQFHGKLTANQETFNMNALTAAHRTLAMPTFVKVTNLSNGRSVILRVNDRGPFAKSRIIDVSRRAAQMLGFEKQGTTRVRVQASDERGKVFENRKARARDKGRVEVTKAEKIKGHIIQVGAFASVDNARKRANELARQDQKARITREKTNGQTLYKVRIGPFKDRNRAQRALDKILRLGFYDARVFTLQ